VTEAVADSAASDADAAAEAAQPPGETQVAAAADLDATPTPAPQAAVSGPDAPETVADSAAPTDTRVAGGRTERRSLLSALAFWDVDRQPASAGDTQQAVAEAPEPLAAAAAPPPTDTSVDDAASTDTPIAEGRPEPRSLLSALAFWDVTRRPAAAEAIQQAVAEASEPIPAAALSVDGMTAPEIEALLTELLAELRTLRQELEQREPATETALPGPEDAPAVDEPAETDSAEPTEPAAPSDDAPTATAAVDDDAAAGSGEESAPDTAPGSAATADATPAQSAEAAGDATAAPTPEADQVAAAADAASTHAGDLAAEVEQLRAELAQRSARLEDAEAIADALDDAEAKIVAMQARLDQETTALEQQLDVVRGQRDRIATEVAADLRGVHATAMEDAEGQLTAMQARLDQERTALSQQLEVVRAQRDEAQAAARSRIAEREHAAAIAAAERQINAIEARLEQQTHALHQQLEVVRGQRDATAAEVAGRVPADEHRAAVRAAERQLNALGARLAQQTHALDQQLEVVRGQRDEAAAEVSARIPPREHGQAIAALEGRIKALQARLDQQTHALDQQLAVVRAQRDDIESVAAERIARLQAEHAQAIEELEARIAAGDTRQEQEREALRQQLAVVREQRDAAEAETEAEIERLRQRLADSRAAEEEARAAETEAEAAVAAEAAQRALAETAAALGGRVTEDGVVLNLGGEQLRFASGSATLPAGELPDIDRTAKLLSERPELTARIEGHTDSVGSRALNQSLSRQRAEAVMAALVERGVDPSRLTAEGVGPDRPIADNTTPAGRSQNRRVEIYVASREQVAEGSAGAN
jgi:outer membrane protein OmpA-like peptidoglycan-associated protein